MVRNEIIAEILKLDVTERRLIINAVTASLPEEIEVQLSLEDQELLQRRLEALRRDPSRGVTLEQFKEMLKERRLKANA